jgi:hypothetical protein
MYKVRRKVVVLESCDADNLIRNEIQFQLFHRYSFKSLINTKNTKVPAHYYVGCRLGQILHARQRMNCSALNDNLLENNNTKRLNKIEKVKNIM